MTDASTTPTRSQRWTTALDGNRLRKLRHQRGLSQEELAGQAGISLTTISRLEKLPQASCRPRTLSRLAAVLGKDPASLSPATPTSTSTSAPPPARLAAPTAPRPIRMDRR